MRGRSLPQDALARRQAAGEAAHGFVLMLGHQRDRADRGGGAHSSGSDRSGVAYSQPPP